MSEFYLYEEQDGGCDYTIGCGKRLRKLKAADTESALQEAKSINTNEFGDDEPMIHTEGQYCPSKAWIFAVESVVEIDIRALACERRFVKSAQQQQEREKRERAEYERLSAKFGGKP